MSKKIDTSAIMNELEGASAFFTKSPVTPPLQPPAPEPAVKPEVSETEAKPLPASEATVMNQDQDRSLGIQAPEAHVSKRKPASRSASTIASKQTSEKEHVTTEKIQPDDLIETLRKTVKRLGREAFFIRLTPEEKQQINSTVYALNEMYRGDGHTTTANEVGRIAVNWLLEDYRTNGEHSVLVRVLDALNA